MDAPTEQENQPAFDAPDGFALRIKHKKHILCVPVYPSTRYNDLAELCLELLSDAGLEPPQKAGVSSFDDLEAEDVAFFSGAYGHVLGGTPGTGQDAIYFAEVDRKKKATIGAMGLKDGPEAVLYLGFRSGSKGLFSQPDVTIAANNGDDMDEADVVPSQTGKGKGRA